MDEDDVAEAFAPVAMTRGEFKKADDPSPLSEVIDDIVQNHALTADLVYLRPYQYMDDDGVHPLAVLEFHDRDRDAWGVVTLPGAAVRMVLLLLTRFEEVHGATEVSIVDRDEQTDG